MSCSRPKVRSATGMCSLSKSFASDISPALWSASARLGNNHREPGYERVDKLLADVEAAGSWAGYAREPRKKMLVLAKLCEKGRATPPRRDRVLGALFAGTGGGSRRKGAAVVIPREVFWKVFEFWPCSH